jgi:flagellar M-ring protein FliF
MASPLTQLKELWQRLQTAQRITVVGAAVATLGVIVALVYYGAQPDYKVLFSDLKPSDAQRIVEKLQAENVPYELKNNGTLITVPAERVTELRLQLASEGALSGGHVGFDIFDKSNFGATDFAQRVNYQRALEGELARTLEGMDEVESARVHVTPARESICGRTAPCRANAPRLCAICWRVRWKASTRKMFRCSIRAGACSRRPGKTATA